MDIDTCMAQIIVLQKEVSITIPGTVDTMDLEVAYKYVPPMSVQQPANPFMQNSWTLVNEDRRVDLRVQDYTVHRQLLVYDADMDQAADIATAFHVQLVNKFDSAVNLNGTCSSQSLRGGNPTLVVIDRAGQHYAGLDLFLDIKMMEAKTFAI